MSLHFSPRFYVTFWSLNIYDLHIPRPSYAHHVAELRKQMDTVDNNRSLSSSKRDKERDRLQGMINKLHDEEKKQSDHVARVCARVKHERDGWFFPSKSWVK